MAKMYVSPFGNSAMVAAALVIAGAAEYEPVAPESIKRVHASSRVIAVAAVTHG